MKDIKKYISINIISNCEKNKTCLIRNFIYKNENIHSTESIDKQYKQNGKRYEQNRYSEESLDLDKNPDKNEIQINDKDEMAKELRENNDKICNYICNLKSQREELIYIIEKQYDERKRLETEMERITYKLCLVRLLYAI